MEELTQTSPALPSSDDCNIAMLAHLLGIVTGFIGPLIVWLLKKDDSPFIAQESREALNFQITMAIAYLICSMLFIVVIGALLMPLLWIVNLVFCIIAAVSASKGVAYRYPISLRLIK